MFKRNSKGQFAKGLNPWNKGKKWDKKTRDKIGKGNRGKKLSKETRERMRGRTPWNKGIKKATNTGRTHFKKGFTPWNKGMEDFNKGHPATNTKPNSGSFEKRHIPYNKGKICPEISERLKGHSVSKDHIEKLRKVHKGKHRSLQTEFEKGMIPWNRGKTSKTDKRIPAKNTHHNWKGGISKNLYPSKFNKGLKLKIRTRDNFICCLCGKTEKEELEKIKRVLSVNHIDFDKNNCKENNLNTLCMRCNVKINKRRKYWTNYFKSKL